jgi:glycosyltransferase involved in cell wall biosynthesis
MRQTISVAIITLNEEVNLPRTLASVQFADQIVVLDSGSTDRTVEIAKSFRATVIEQPWLGFAAQKNTAIACCTGDWILSLDADEELSLDLQDQMRALIPSNPPIDAYFIKRRNLFLGRWIRHGGFYPDPKLRLFRRNAVDFSQTPQFQDRLVHETIAFDGASSTLDYDLIHHAYPTLEDYIEHMNRYSTLGAQHLLLSNRAGVNSAQFCFRVLVVPVLSFLWNYTVRLGFLDGREGLLLHLYQAAYSSWKYAKLWQRLRSGRSDDSGTRTLGDALHASQG